MKKSLKKGGVGDVVTLVIIIGLALALIVAVVVPSIQRANDAGHTANEAQEDIDDAISGLEGVTYTAEHSTDTGDDDE